MLNAEARDKDVKAAELELKAEMAEIEKEKTAARERTAEDEKLLAEWNAKRNQARAGVNEDLLRQYERVSKFRGSGIAEVRDQKCMGCQVMLRPQTYNEVRGGQIVVCESCQRVLYFDPATGVAVERPSLTAKRRARPKTHVDKAWFYRAEYGDLGEVFFAFMNADGSASRRVYDAHTGRKIGDTQYQPGDFSAVFADDIKSGVRLHTTLDLQQLEEWASELPMTELDELHADLKKALREAPLETAAVGTSRRQLITTNHVGVRSCHALKVRRFVASRRENLAPRRPALAGRPRLGLSLRHRLRRRSCARAPRGRHR